MTHYDSGYAPIWNAEIVADLLELLMEPDVQWYELEELLVNSPVEIRFIRLLHSSRAGRPTFLGKTPSTDFGLDEDARQILLHRVFPYATLLDTRLSPFEQAAQLNREGVDVIDFCQWLQSWSAIFQQSSRPDVYLDAGRLVTKAWIDHHSLLRGAERRPEPKEHLLRAANSSELLSDDLLHSSAARPESLPSPAPAPWWKRLLPNKKA